jgi:tetratricopeptide (TPR) repeat protein
MRVLWLLAASGLALSAPAIAAGGGGGGGMPQSPGASAPQYDPAAEYRAGIAALEAKDFKKAKTSFDRVLAVAATDANVQYLAGVARTGLGDLKAARRYYAKAAKLDSTMVPAWRDLGLTDASLGDSAKAQDALAAIRTQRGACAETCAKAADLKDAEAAVAAALASGGTPAAAPSPSAMAVPAGGLLLASTGFGDSQYLDAVALINERRYAAAITALEAARQVFGPHPDILTYLGFANRKLGRFAIAEGYYRAALAAAPGHRGATEYFGELMVERRDLAGARRMLASLDSQCRFGCTEAEELRAWIAAGRSPHSL